MQLEWRHLPGISNDLSNPSAFQCRHYCAQPAMTEKANKRQNQNDDNNNQICNNWSMQMWYLLYAET